MKISVIPDHPSLLLNNIFNENCSRDLIYQPHKVFYDLCIKSSWEIGTFDVLPIVNADKVLIFGGLYFPEKILEALKIVGPSNMIGVFLEPPGIQPLFYNKNFQSCFNKILIVSSMGVDNKQVYYTYFPIAKYNTDWVNFINRKKLVNISSGKIQEFPGSLYHERIRAINYFQNNYKNQFELWGNGWNNKIIDLANINYKGICTSKQEILRNFQFSICFENSDNVPGYVTEKMFDSLQAGCIPIYLGSQDIKEQVPENCFVDWRKYKSYDELSDELESFDEVKFKIYLENINTYLKSHNFVSRLPDQFASSLFNAVNAKHNSIGITNNEEIIGHLYFLCGKKLIKDKKFFSGFILMLKNFKNEKIINH